MKKVLALFLFFLFVSPFLLKVVMVVDWFVNHQYIIENLCVQKDKAENTCQGMCHLSKNLDKVDSAQDKEDNSKKIPPFTEYSFFTLVSSLNLKQAPKIFMEQHAFAQSMFNQFSPFILSPPPQYI